MRVTKASLAIAAAGITIVSAGLASMLPAAASPARAAQPTTITSVIDTNFAGYLTGGNWRFRYISADVPMAACRSAANQNAVAGIALKSNIFSEVALQTTGPMRPRWSLRRVPPRAIRHASTGRTVCASASVPSASDR
jgi:hypothetical protein